LNLHDTYCCDNFGLNPGAKWRVEDDSIAEQRAYSKILVVRGTCVHDLMRNKRLSVL
jgi:hypothetical protein